jgi:hypothetical protein
MTCIEIINTICNILTALGTVGAVIVALWLSNRDSNPKLKIFAQVGVITPDINGTTLSNRINSQQCSHFFLLPLWEKVPRPIFIA